MRRLLLPLALLWAAAPAVAEPETHSLTETQKQEILTRKTEADLALPVQTQILTDRRPHGEVGFMVGTGGTRGVYGATSVPLGDNGWASFAFESSRSNWSDPYGSFGSDPRLTPRRPLP
ncbi:hypothetical protein [Sandaracinobacteroides hominis]|uniref:hypothetical protein n=1 Tax=Sandaracinobacteroides hominis TaxID=2780086 RepID=UPI0018F592AA|nr:hypothetical protein [Sandaracinobacteroides hominis]